MAPPPNPHASAAAAAISAHMAQARETTPAAYPATVAGLEAAYADGVRLVLVVPKLSSGRGAVLMEQAAEIVPDAVYVIEAWEHGGELGLDKRYFDGIMNVSSSRGQHEEANHGSTAVIPDARTEAQTPPHGAGRRSSHGRRRATFD